MSPSDLAFKLWAIQQNRLQHQALSFSELQSSYKQGNENSICTNWDESFDIYADITWKQICFQRMLRQQRIELLVKQAK